MRVGVYTFARFHAFMKFKIKWIRFVAEKFCFRRKWRQWTRIYFACAGAPRKTQASTCFLTMCLLLILATRFKNETSLNRGTAAFSFVSLIGKYLYHFTPFWSGDLFCLEATHMFAPFMLSALPTYRLSLIVFYYTFNVFRELYFYIIIYKKRTKYVI